MTDKTIVPFANAASKRAHDARQAGEGEDVTATINNLLRVIEGQESQIHALIQLVHDHDRRIRLIEKASKSKIIRGIA